MRGDGRSVVWMVLATLLLFGLVIHVRSLERRVVQLETAAEHRR